MERVGLDPSQVSRETMVDEDPTNWSVQPEAGSLPPGRGSATWGSYTWT